MVFFVVFEISHVNQWQSSVFSAIFQFLQLSTKTVLKWNSSMFFSKET